MLLLIFRIVGYMLRYTPLANVAAKPIFPLEETVGDPKKKKKSPTRAPSPPAPTYPDVDEYDKPNIISNKSFPFYKGQLSGDTKAAVSKLWEAFKQIESRHPILGALLADLITSRMQYHEWCIMGEDAKLLSSFENALGVCWLSNKEQGIFKNHIILQISTQQIMGKIVNTFSHEAIHELFRELVSNDLMCGAYTPFTSSEEEYCSAFMQDRARELKTNELWHILFEFVLDAYLPGYAKGYTPEQLKTSEVKLKILERLSAEIVAFLIGAEIENPGSAIAAAPHLCEYFNKLIASALITYPNPAKRLSNTLFFLNAPISKVENQDLPYDRTWFRLADILEHAVFASLALPRQPGNKTDLKQESTMDSANPPSSRLAEAKIIARVTDPSDSVAQEMKLLIAEMHRNVRQYLELFYPYTDPDRIIDALNQAVEIANSHPESKDEKSVIALGEVRLNVENDFDAGMERWNQIRQLFPDAAHVMFTKLFSDNFLFHDKQQATQFLLNMQLFSQLHPEAFSQTAANDPYRLFNQHGNNFEALNREVRKHVINNLNPAYMSIEFQQNFYGRMAFSAAINGRRNFLRFLKDSAESGVPVSDEETKSLEKEIGAYLYIKHDFLISVYGSLIKLFLSIGSDAIDVFLKLTSNWIKSTLKHLTTIHQLEPHLLGALIQIFRHAKDGEEINAILKVMLNAWSVLMTIPKSPVELLKFSRAITEKLYGMMPELKHVGDISTIIVYIVECITGTRISANLPYNACQAAATSTHAFSNMGFSLFEHYRRSRNLGDIERPLYYHVKTHLVPVSLAAYYFYGAYTMNDKQQNMQMLILGVSLFSSLASFTQDLLLGNHTYKVILNNANKLYLQGKYQEALDKIVPGKKLFAIEENIRNKKSLSKQFEDLERSIQFAIYFQDKKYEEALALIKPDTQISLRELSWLIQLLYQLVSTTAPGQKRDNFIKELKRHCGLKQEDNHYDDKPAHLVSALQYIDQHQLELKPNLWKALLSAPETAIHLVRGFEISKPIISSWFFKEELVIDILKRSGEHAEGVAQFFVDHCHFRHSQETIDKVIHNRVYANDISNALFIMARGGLFADRLLGNHRYESLVFVRPAFVIEIASSLVEFRRRFWERYVVRIKGDFNIDIGGDIRDDHAYFVRSVENLIVKFPKHINEIIKQCADSYPKLREYEDKRSDDDFRKRKCYNEMNQLCIKISTYLKDLSHVGKQNNSNTDFFKKTQQLTTSVAEQNPAKLTPLLIT